MTGYSEYAVEAFKVRASGYLLKPVQAKDIRIELDNIGKTTPISTDKRVRIQTFGNFEIYVDGQLLHFECNQAKEVLAYLVDCRGTSASRAEIAAALWEEKDYDRPRQKQLDYIIGSMMKTLKSVSADGIILRTRLGIMLKTEEVDCDIYRFLDGDTTAINNFSGTYMSSYSWAERICGSLIMRENVPKD